MKHIMLTLFEYGVPTLMAIAFVYGMYTGIVTKKEK
jgi:hypothetical protein